MNPHIFNRYAHMKFDTVVVEQPQENPDGFGENLGSEDVFKQTLIDTANELGIKIKRSWGIKKLRKAIDDHAAGHNNSST